MFQFSTASFTAAAVWEFENIHKKIILLIEWFYHTRRKYVGNLFDDYYLYYFYFNNLNVIYCIHINYNENHMEINK